MRVRVHLCGCAAIAAVLAIAPAASAQIVPPPLPLSGPDTSATPAKPVPASFSNLFTETLGDLTRLRSRENLTWLGIGGAAALAAHAGDHGVTTTLGEAHRLDGTFDSGSTLGGMPVQFGSALATFAIGKITNKPSVTALGGDLVRAQLVAQTVSFGVKVAVQRTRPDGTSYSFPSGHAASSFASATVLQQHFGWKAGVPAYAVASYVAASRIQDNRHYLSDVVFGATIGLVAGRTVTIGRGEAKFAVTPLAAPGGAGVGFTLVPHK
jgi:membrane-associated phospholipid phosphatase